MDLFKERLLSFTESAVAAIAGGLKLQGLVDMAAAQFSLPLIVVDVGYQMIACSNHECFPDPFWEQIRKKGGPSDHTIVKYYIEDGFLDAIAKADGAICVDWGVCRDYPQTSGPIYVNQSLEGFVSVLFIEADKQELSLALNQTMCQLCSILMRVEQYPLKLTQNPVREVLSQKIFDTGHFPGTPQLSEYRPYVVVEPQYCILYLVQKNQKTNLLSHVKRRLLSGYSQLLYHTEGNGLWIFIHHYSQEVFQQMMTSFLHDEDIYCGCSELFDSLEHREVYIQQARLALETGQKIAPEKSTFEYADYYPELLLMLAAEQLEQANAIPGKVKAIIAFDQKNGTEYRKTLEAFLFERNDINKTAGRLHLHRNTLIYRLARIKEILQVETIEPELSWELQVGLTVYQLIN